MEKRIDMEVKKKEIIVFESKTTHQKMVTIPKNCNIHVGDKIGIYKIVDDEEKQTE